jgi:hypothetical protein
LEIRRREKKLENKKEKDQNPGWADSHPIWPIFPFSRLHCACWAEKHPAGPLAPFSFSFSLCHCQVGPPGQLYLPRRQPTRLELLLCRKLDSVRNKPPRIGRVIVATRGSLASVDQTERSKSSPTMALNRTWSRGIRISALASPVTSAWPSGPLDAATIPSARRTPSLVPPRVRGISAASPNLQVPDAPRLPRAAPVVCGLGENLGDHRTTAAWNSMSCLGCSLGRVDGVGVLESRICGAERLQFVAGVGAQPDTRPDRGQPRLPRKP